MRAGTGPENRPEYPTSTATPPSWDWGAVAVAFAHGHHPCQGQLSLSSRPWEAPPSGSHLGRLFQ